VSVHAERALQPGNGADGGGSLFTGDGGRAQPPSAFSDQLGW